MSAVHSIIKLDVLIASYGEEGLIRLSRLTPPEIPGVRWLISSQIPDGNFPEIPQNLQREDIAIRFSASIGSSLNRNLLLDMAQAPVCLIADDDLIFSPDGILKVIDSFEKHPEIDLAAFEYDILRTTDRDNPDLSLSTITEKTYPSSSFPLDRPPKGFYISAIEMAFRNRAIMVKKIRFNENFGVNALYPCGEDTIFLHDCLKAGLKGRFFPILIASHIGTSTGIREMDSTGVLRSQGVLIPLMYPTSGLARIFLKAWRSSRGSKRSFPSCLLHLLKGWTDLILYKKRLFPYPKITLQ